MTRKSQWIIAITIVFVSSLFAAPTPDISLVDPPQTVPCFDMAEFTVTISSKGTSLFKNPFTDAKLTAEVKTSDGTTLNVTGFCDSENGQIYRLRFCPHMVGKYHITMLFHADGIEKKFSATLTSQPSDNPGPVIVDPHHPKHFIYLGSEDHFYHLGHTVYHLIDPSTDDSQVAALIDYCHQNGFNKIRFLLTGYPRDTDNRTSNDVEYGVADPWKNPNYGSKPGQVNPLPAWPGRPHHYDFTRFNVSYWQRVDRAVKRMRKQGIIATCIITIEKQSLFKEYGKLTDDEYRLYRYAVARLGAFDNVWFDLGNEHNEFRNKAWGDTMGNYVKNTNPFGSLLSAHGHEEFSYTKSPWADFIITQNYGTPQEVYKWAMNFYSVPKPYINEEYGYEGQFDKPGHGQNANLVRQCHWAIAMSGGYASYGDWSNGVSYFYMGTIGPGKAAQQLKHLRTFFEKRSYWQLSPQDKLTTTGFCLALPPKDYVFYFPTAKHVTIDLSSAKDKSLQASWFNPRTGQYSPGPAFTAGKNTITCPDSQDWTLYVHSTNAK